VATDQHRGALEAARDKIEQLDRRCAGPVQVFENEYEPGALATIRSGDGAPESKNRRRAVGRR